MSAIPSAAAIGFELLAPPSGDPAHHDPSPRRTALAARALPPTLGNHKEAAKHYQPDPTLVDAINVALAVGAPLLLTGEPGTGKTQVAHYIAWYFGIELFPLYVRSDTTAEHLLYSFDAVAYLRSANDTSPGMKHSRGEFVEKGPLWRAYESDHPAVVLLDEIDKASRDFPNDLLHVLDQHEFPVRERNETIRRLNGAPPIIVITSNTERRLPEAFLRRCIFHHIEFTEDLVRSAVRARLGDFPSLPAEIREAAISRFLALRGRELRKKPATAELLVWLTVLAARTDITIEKIETARWIDLPAISTLVKDRDDLKLLG